MGTLEGDERRSASNSNSNVDSSDDETQEFDSQFSPGGGTEDDLNIMNTMTFNDTYQLEDAFETQMANLAAETQLVDLPGETQMVDLAGETQMVDLYEESQMVDLYGETQVVDLTWETQVVDLPGETQVLDEFDAELGDFTEHGQTNKADVMCETQRLSEYGDDSAKLDGGDLVGMGSTVDKDPPKEESPRRGFTAIRTASIRASGLASCARASRDLSTSSTSSGKSSLEQSELDGGHKSTSGRRSDQEILENCYNDENERKSRSTAVRKLFEEQDVEADNSDTETNQIDDNLDGPELLACENNMAGLSYLDSQEPGELSQARALEVVDKFLDLGFLEDEGFSKRVINAEKSKVVSAAKGSRDLANKSMLQNAVGECGIYDWDDAREDDGGGEFFLKKKELFFDGPKKKCVTEPRKSKAVRASEDKKEKRCTKTKLANSDSGLLHKVTSKSKTPHPRVEELRKNIMKNFDEHVHKASEPELSDNDAAKGIPDVSNIGPDTQMAAEAMEDLCFEVRLDDCNNSGDEADRQKKLKRKTTHSEHFPPSVGVVTRQSKRTKRISTRNSPNECSKTKKRPNKVLGEADQRSLAAVNMEDQLDFSVPMANRTPKSRKLNSLKKVAAANSVSAYDVINEPPSGRACRKRTAARAKNAVTMTLEEIRKVGLSRLKQLNKKCVVPSSTSDTKVGNLQGKRYRQETLADSERLKSSGIAASIPKILNKDHSDHSSPRLDSESRKIIPRKTVSGRNSRNDAAPFGSDQLNGKSTLDGSKKGDEKSYDTRPVRGAKGNDRLPSSPCATPAARTRFGYNVSPICMGDEYQKQSCRKNLSVLSLTRETDFPLTGSPETYGGMRESRKRKDITTVRVLFSQHLDEDVVKQQKKILARLGGAVASSMLDATHFVADEFVRTRNMLEAIASGKPVVTHLWIESCGEASCLIDEKNHILRDAKKEKEFGFCLPVSLARACQQPLLQGQKVFITPNTKPGKDILANLVKAVHGLPIERLGRSAFKDDKSPDDLLILSCEEDYDACVPFLEKGGAIYSSELLLNGIVKQKLEYERHCLFADHVKRTRSTMWLKKRNKFVPVAN